MVDIQNDEVIELDIDVEAVEAKFEKLGISKEEAASSKEAFETVLAGAREINYSIAILLHGLTPEGDPDDTVYSYEDIAVVNEDGIEILCDLEGFNNEPISFDEMKEVYFAWEMRGKE